jgi:ABC-type polysaccharide/polyol phosphate export permease
MFLTFAIFFTPVFYEVGLFKEWGNWLLLNPVAPILEGLATAAVDGGTPNLPWLSYSIVVSVLVLAGSYALFRWVEPAFAECI